MPRPVTTGINRATRHRADGSVAGVDFYHRQTGALLGRSRDGMTETEAIEARHGLELPRDADGAPAPVTLGQLCTAYVLFSPAFAALEPATRTEYRGHIRLIRARFGAGPLGSLTRRGAVAFHAEFAATPWRGNAVMRTLRLIINYGIRELELAALTRNPAAGIVMFPTPPRQQIWDQASIDAFLDIATEIGEERIRVGMALLLYTVQRLTDTLRMSRATTWLDPTGRRWIRLRQRKTGAALDVPCHGRLAEEIERAIALNPDSEWLVPGPGGAPWDRRAFARIWDAAMASAALAGLQRRDLRRTGVVQLALAGATIPMIAAMAGWKLDHTQRIVETYLPRSGAMALAGVEAWEAAAQAPIHGPAAPLAPRRR